MCYDCCMVRVTFLIDESEHDRLAAAALSRGVPKAALLRELIDAQLPKASEQEVLPHWKTLLQAMDVEPLNVSVDEYLYGSSANA